MWGKNKSQYKHDLMKYHRDIDHTPLKKKPDNHGSLSDQLREKVVQNHSKEILENNTQQPTYAVNFLSKTFGPIKIKEIKDDEYTPQDVVNFFSALDYMWILTVYVEKYNYIDSDCIFSVILKPNIYMLPVSLFRIALPQSIKDEFKNRGNYYTVYTSLFEAYGRKLIVKYAEQ